MLVGTPVTNVLAVVAAAGVGGPVGAHVAWLAFGSGFMAALAPVELPVSRGPLAVGVTTAASLLELTTVTGWCLLPGLLVLDDGATLLTEPVGFMSGGVGSLQRLAASFARGWAPAVVLAAYLLYLGVALLWCVSYARAMDTQSDALFTIDKQKNEIICERCSRLVRRHTQHCAFCWRCVDRFDHHSFWINNCVGERNSKYYTLALLYNLLRCLAVLGAVCASGLRPVTPCTLLLLVATAACSAASLTCTAFLFFVWAVAVSYGFNSSTPAGASADEGSSSLEVLDAVLTLLAKRPSPALLSWCTWEKELELPRVTSLDIYRNWSHVMGLKSTMWWWWPSSPYKFPDHGQHAFIFKKAW